MILVVDHDAGPAKPIELALPAGRVLGDSLAQLLVLAEQLGAGHLEPRIGVDRAPGPSSSLRAVVVLEQRRMAIVIAEEPVGHPVAAGEPRRLVGKPDRLLSPADGASLAGQRVELPAADPGQHASPPRSRRSSRGRSSLEARSARA